MKILFLINKFPEISQTFILNQIVYLLNSNINLKILSLKQSDKSVKHNEIEKIINIVTYLDKHNSYKIASLLTNKIKSYPKIFRTISKLISPNEFFLLPSYFSLLIYLLAKRPDIIHCHFGPLGILVSKLKFLKLFNGKIVTSFHGYDLSKFFNTNEGRENNVYTDLIDNGSLFLPVSKYWKLKLVNLGFPESKIKVHKMGIDTSYFRYKKPAKKPTKVLSIGRLFEKKGFYYSILAFKNFLNKNTDKNIVYEIIGSGPEYTALNNLIRENKLNNKVRLIGALAKNEIRDYLNSSDIFILPSVTAENGDMEGIPVVLMEAMATGLPVISTFHSGIPELVENNVSGLLVQEKNINELSEALQKLIDNPYLREKLSRNARKKIEKDHDFFKLNRNIIKHYEEICFSNNSTFERL